ncbi:NUDIX hydrolase [Dyella telluris]|uniref:NUDIX domain-containing protein n=1 Tax=Dyella telluris TaxID=2763498 RepID=A0A7G8Q1N1_9GAMM|nr:NUDIX domain-containing protein [Dyella telluris]QNK00689.1 NUDIX domain-containing protein [Dyella telluris]
MRQRFQLTTSVFVIVCREDNVLLLRRSNTGWMDGYLSLPAGSHDGGETLAVAGARELREETGLVVSPDALRFAHLMHCRSGDTSAEWLGAFFIAERWEGTPALLEKGKHDELGWHDVNRLPPDVIPYTAQGIRCAYEGVSYSDFGWSRP